jgi:hypothetical protein
MVCKNTSAGRGVLQAAAFVSLSASEFLFLSMYPMMKPMKNFSILLTRDRYFRKVGSQAIHSFSISLATTLEFVRRMHL